MGANNSLRPQSLVKSVSYRKNFENAVHGIGVYSSEGVVPKLFALRNSCLVNE
jgi:hypothetical protein